MHLDFAAWNGDVQAAREEYDRMRAGETGMCRNGLHEMTYDNTRRSGGCRRCKNATQAAYHARKKAA